MNKLVDDQATEARNEILYGTMKEPGKLRHFKESRMSLVMQGEIAHGELKENVRKL